MPADFRFAACNEIFGDMPLADICRTVRQIGYTGLELTPHPFAEQKLTPAEVHRMIADAGLTFVGLHWLLVSPPGLNITSSDEIVLRRSWDHVRRMIDACTPGCTVVIGSPKQRSSAGPDDRHRARKVLVDELAAVAPHAQAAEVSLLIEPIPRSETDLVNTLFEAVEIASEIGSPAIATMFDVHNAADETVSHAELIQRFSGYIRHIHLNELDGAEPGTGDYDFPSLFRALESANYAGWISVEAFDFSRPGEQIASTALDCLLAASNRN